MQSGKLIPCTLSEDFDASVVIVTNPSGDAQDMRFALDEPTEANALYTSADHETAGLEWLFRRTHH